MDGMVVLPPQQLRTMPSPLQAAVCTWAPRISPIW
jgi:hypothetical protein